MPDKRSPLEILSDSCERFFWYHPQVKAFLKSSFCLVLCPFATCCTCVKFWNGLGFGCGNAKQQKRGRKRARMFALKMQKRGRENGRRNSLSEKPPASTLRAKDFFRKRRRTCGQEQCALFTKLPVELRMSVYEQVLCEREVVHVFPDYAKEKLWIWRTSSSLGDDMKRDEEIAAAWAHRRQGRLRSTDVAGGSGLNHCHGGRNPQSEFTTLLPLLLSCRRVYTEAIPLLYSANTFAISLGYTFTNFELSVPETHFSRITSLILFTSDSQSFSWQDTDRALLSLTHLKRCHLIFQFGAYGYFPYHPMELQKMFEEVVEHCVERFANKEIFMIDQWAVEGAMGKTGFKYELLRRWRGNQGPVEQLGEH